MKRPQQRPSASPESKRHMHDFSASLLNTPLYRFVTPTMAMRRNAYQAGAPEGIIAKVRQRWLGRVVLDTAPIPNGFSSPPNEVKDADYSAGVVDQIAADMVTEDHWLVGKELFEDEDELR